MKEDPALIQNLLIVLLAVALAFLAATMITGCGAGFFSAKTVATYEITTTGKLISYESSKEEQGLTLDLTEDNGQVKAVKISVDKAGTSPEAIAAAQAVQIKMLEMIQALTAQLAAIAAKGGK